MKIDWSKLESCGGSSDSAEIPRAIELLFSLDEGEREKGYWGIDNHAVVQGDLYSSAPYTARLIVDRFQKEQVITIQLTNILYELHNGHGPEQLSVGLLAGESIEARCRSIVREVESALTEGLSNLESNLAAEVSRLLESFDA